MTNQCQPMHSCMRQHQGLQEVVEVPVATPPRTSPAGATTMIAPREELSAVGHEMDQVHDVVAAMRNQEQTTYLRTNYLEAQQLQLHHILDAPWRQRIIEWMYGVVDHCSLRRDSVATASVYLDICVQRGVVQTREEYQLAAMTALQIAIKLCDSTVVKLQSMVALGRGLFTAQDVIDMERKILSALNWNCHPPTPVCFLRQFLRLLPPSVPPFTRYMIAEVTRFISEISVCLYRFVKYPPSTLAFAGMIIAMDRFDDASLSRTQRVEVFDAMARIGMDVGSSNVMETVSALQDSLGNNASMNELFSTIRAQSPSGGASYSKSCQPSDTSDPAGDLPSPLGSHMNSPRDVMGRHS